jgi:hypothetical protein
MDISFEKDEFNYHAAILIFGKNGSRIKEFSSFDLEIFRQYKAITFSEMSSLTPGGVLDIIRELHISDTQGIRTTDCKLATGINQSVTYLDGTNKVIAVDKIFTDQEYDYFEKNWDIMVKNKIRTLGILIRSIYLGKMVEIPLLINEFPEISKILFDHPEFWTK